VRELSLENGPFWRLFRMESLKKLCFSFRYGTPETDFLDSLSRCQNVEQLELEIEFFATQSNANFYLRLLSVVDALPHLKQFSVNLRCTASEVQRFLSSCPRRMGSYVTRLTMFNVDLPG